MKNSSDLEKCFSQDNLKIAAHLLEILRSDSEKNHPANYRGLKGQTLMNQTKHEFPNIDSGTFYMVLNELCAIGRVNKRELNRRFSNSHYQVSHAYRR